MSTKGDQSQLGQQNPPVLLPIEQRLLMTCRVSRPISALRHPKLCGEGYRGTLYGGLGASAIAAGLPNRRRESEEPLPAIRDTRGPDNGTDRGRFRVITGSRGLPGRQRWPISLRQAHGAELTG